MSRGRFQFSFAPVQSFVAQARRTRDLWAGSYLLSYLAGSALHAVKKAKGNVLFPDADDDPIVQAIGSPTPLKSGVGEIGTLPNRFLAEGENPAELARAAAEGLMNAWQGVCRAVQHELVEIPAVRQAGLLNQAALRIWDRQVSNLWEIMWIVGDEPGLMARRKQWRAFRPVTEPGERCTVCGEREVLSAAPGANLYQCREYWKKMSAAIGSHGWRNEIPEDGSERLCAVCLVKRLYPRVAQDAIGWKVRTAYGSTLELSARDWLRRIEENANDPKIQHAMNRVIKATKPSGIDFETSGTASRESRIWDEFRNLDANAYFGRASLGDQEEPRQDSRLAEALQALAVALSRFDIPGRPSPYYAVLVMDGDRMGQLLEANRGDERAVSKALCDFSRKVPDIIRQHNGETVYAGGDDVLALLPMDTALECAWDLRQAYIESFCGRPVKVPNEQGVSISAGMIFSHMNNPLQQVIRDAHHLLDKEAKEQAGRNAFAIRVWKRSGPDMTVSRPWTSFNNERNGLKELQQLVRATAEGEFSSRFFYKLNDLFETLNLESDEQGMTKEQAATLALVEYLANRDANRSTMPREEQVAKARGQVKMLLDFACPHRPEGKRGCVVQSECLKLIRFLAHKEV